MPTPLDPPSLSASTRPPKLLEELRSRIRTLHYSLRTEESYIAWARRFIIFHGKRHPRDLGAPEVEAFLSHLATERNVAAYTENHAKAALLFLYKVCAEYRFAVAEGHYRGPSLAAIAGRPQGT